MDNVGYKEERLKKATMKKKRDRKVAFKLSEGI
jgi:hypothetical protein